MVTSNLQGANFPELGSPAGAPPQTIVGADFLAPNPWSPRNHTHQPKFTHVAARCTTRCAGPNHTHTRCAADCECVTHTMCHVAHSIPRAIGGVGGRQLWRAPITIHIGVAHTQVGPARTRSTHNHTPHAIAAHILRTAYACAIACACAHTSYGVHQPDAAYTLRAPRAVGDLAKNMPTLQLGVKPYTLACAN